MKKLSLFAIAFLGLSLPAFARVGTVFVIDKIAPKNGGFVGVVDSSQTVTSTSSFNGNLSAADIDVQKALDTLDNLTVSGSVILSTFTVGATNFVLVTDVLQSGATFFVSSGSINGPFTIYKSGKGIFSFDPSGGANSLVLDNRDVTGAYSELSSRYVGSEMWRFRGNNDSSNGLFNFSSSSQAGGGNVQIRYAISRMNGKHQFNDLQGATFIEFNPVGNSSFTIPIFASSGSFSTSLNASSILNAPHLSGVNVAAVGDIAISTYAISNSSGTMIFYADQKWFVVATTSPPPQVSGYVPKTTGNGGYSNQPVGGAGGSGTVTSVAVSGGGLFASPAPIVGAGTIYLMGGNTNYIQVSDTLQSGSTFYVSSGTAQQLIVVPTANGAVFNVLNSTRSTVMTVDTTPAGLGTMFQLLDSTGRAVFAWNGAGHMVTQSTQPVLSSCGTSPSLSTNSNDNSGTVTVGSTASGCTVTFANAYRVAPTCVISERTMSVVNGLSYTTSTTALTLTETTFGGVLFDYFCIDH